MSALAQARPVRPQASTRAARVAWYRQPIFWLAAALFVASLAGCIVTIIIALAQPSDALPDGGERVFRVPTSHGPVTTP